MPTMPPLPPTPSAAASPSAAARPALRRGVGALGSQMWSFMRSGAQAEGVLLTDGAQAHAAQLPPCIVRPTNPWKARWDVWMAALIIYSILMVPARVGFAWRACLFEPEWWLDVVVDLCFAIDIALSFRTAVVVEMGERNQQLLVVRPRAIARRYMCGWFVFDLASTVPVDNIVDLVSYAEVGSAAAVCAGAASAFKSIQTLRMLRLVSTGRTSSHTSLAPRAHAHLNLLRYVANAGTPAQALSLPQARSGHQTMGGVARHEPSVLPLRPAAHCHPLPLAPRRVRQLLKLKANHSSTHASSVQQSVRSSYRASRVDSEVEEDEDEFGPEGKPIQTIASPVTSLREGEANGGGHREADGEASYHHRRTSC